MPVTWGTLGLGTNPVVGGANEVLAGIGKFDTTSCEPTSPGDSTAVDHQVLPIPASPGNNFISEAFEAFRVHQTLTYIRRMAATSASDETIVTRAVKLLRHATLP